MIPVVPEGPQLRQKLDMLEEEILFGLHVDPGLLGDGGAQPGREAHRLELATVLQNNPEITPWEVTGHGGKSWGLGRLSRDSCPRRPFG